MFDPISNQLAEEAKKLAQQLADGEIDTGILRTNIDQKLNELETQYAPDLNNVKSQLADTTNHIDFKEMQFNATFAQRAIRKLEDGKEAVIVFLGDSTTETNSHTEGGLNHVQRFTEYLTSRYGSKATVINSGVSGDTIRQMWSRAHADVCKYNPDLVVICSGLNDSTESNNITNAIFEDSYRGAIEEILGTTNADIVLRTPNKTESHPVVNDRIETDLIPIIRRLANSYNLGLVDVYSLWNRLLEGGVTWGELNNDSYHPNSNGQGYIFDYMKPLFEPFGNIVATNKDIPRVVTAGDNDILTTLGNPSNGDNYYNGKTYLLYNYGSNKWAELDFYGTGVKVITALSSSSGKIKVEIDGQEVASSIDLYNSSTLWRKYHAFTGLTEGEHTVRVTVLDEKNANSSGNSLFLMGFLITGEEAPVEKTIPRKLINGSETTFDMKNTIFAEMNQSSPVQLSNITGGENGQYITLMFNNSNTTILHNSYFDLTGNTTWTPSPGSGKSTLTLLHWNGKWYETGRSN